MKEKFKILGDFMMGRLITTTICHILTKRNKFLSPRLVSSPLFV